MLHNDKGKMTNESVRQRQWGGFGNEVKKKQCHSNPVCGLAETLKDLQLSSVEIFIGVCLKTMCSCVVAGGQWDTKTHNRGVHLNSSTNAKDLETPSP